MRIERAEILGVPVEKSFSVTSTDRFGGRVEISEDCLDPKGNYGDPGNRRSVSTYFPEKEFDPTSGSLRSSWSSTGTLTRYTYARGEFLGGGGMPGDFKVDPSHAQLFTRVESVTTPNTMPEGIPNLTTKDVSIYDKHGHLVYSETRLLTANEGRGDIPVPQQPGHPAQADFNAVLTWQGRD